MNQFHSCAPIYFLGAVIFLIAGAILIYFNHPDIGVIVGIPGILLLLFTFVTVAVLLGLRSTTKNDLDSEKRGENILIVKNNSERVKPIANAPKTRKKRKRKKR